MMYWAREKVGLAWWHSQILRETHYVIFWAGDQYVIMSCRNSVSPASLNSCAHWQLALLLNIKMFCCFGRPTDAFLERHKHCIQQCEGEFRALFSKFHAKRDLSLLQCACDLTVTPTAVWGALRHLVAGDRCCLFPPLAGELTAEAQRSVENCVCGSGELAFCIKREGWGLCVCVCVQACACSFVPICVCIWKPVISPSKSTVHQLAWHVALE